LGIGLPCKKTCTESSVCMDYGEFPSEKGPQFSFLTQNKKKSTLNNISIMSSFVQRNTPSKKTTVDIIELKRQQLLAKEEEARIRRQRVQEQKLRETEEKRKNREQRQALAAERRKEQNRKKKELTEKEIRKEQEKMILKAKILEQKQQEEKEKHRFREMKLEEIRKREMERQKEQQELIQEQETERQKQQDVHLRKKEYDQQLRQKQIQEYRQKNEEYIQELERERQLEAERLRQADLQREKEKDFQIKEKQERSYNNMAKDLAHLERQRVKEEKARIKEELNAKEREKRQQKLNEKHQNDLKQNPPQNDPHFMANSTTVPEIKSTQPHVSQQLNATFNKDESNAHDNPDRQHHLFNSPTLTYLPSYDMTPVRKVYLKNNSGENYNIDDIRSDDSTDDDETPRKKIPSWATGTELKASLISQYYTPPDLDTIFAVIEQPNLCEMFSKKKPKFFKRTSSAVWNSPMYLPSGKPYSD
ncbi:hypothetical protein LSH36_488g02003, partial [Paralvinella palmiformis]